MSAYAYVANLGKRVVSDQFRTRNKDWILSAKAKLARGAWLVTKGHPSHLSYRELKELQNYYQREAPKSYSYAPDALVKRGRERREEIKRLHWYNTKPRSRIIEIGCGDGMALAAFADEAHQLVGIDHSAERFDQKAIELGVEFQAQDATALPFPDNSFDLAFSYNSFEHFADPTKVFSEMCRVLAPGGLFVANFGPLYPSPWGLHGYDVIHVPYCQYLFNHSELNRFCDEYGKPRIKYEYVNNWSATQFRKLFTSSSSTMTTLLYEEGTDLNGVDLILRFPKCFVQRAIVFDDFITSSILTVQVKGATET